jgi:predicted RNase H-like HicB family nuclease
MRHKFWIVIDWNKLAGETNSIQSLRDNVQKVMEDTGRYSQSVIDGVKDAFEDELNELHAKIIEFRENKLASKEENINRAKPSRSDLRRLAELNDLGIFQSAHDRLLNSIIGIPDLQSEDLEELEQLAKAASDLYREIDKNYGSDVFASSALQSIQRNIDRIIQRNINNKSTLLKIVSGVKSFFDVYLTGLLMGPLTIVENWLSGIKEVGSPLWLGKKNKLTKEDAQLYGSMLLDILQRGQAFGEEIGSFAPRELYSNTLKYKFKNATKKEIAESMLAVLMTPARIGLLGFDSANKAVITNKVFKNAMFSALITHGKSEEEAERILNEALHGTSWETAKGNAEKILNNLNNKLPISAKIPVNPNTITRLANDLVKANLNANGVITNEMIESALKGSYHVAGFGLGHEPNNFLSKGVKGIRDASVKKEQELLKEKDWDALAWHRLKSTLVNGVILKFTGGATNWLVLRAQSGLGLGLATGFMGKYNKEIDFKNKDTIQQSIKEIQGARNQIGRSLTGISYTLAGYLLMWMLAGGDDEEKKKRLAALKGQKHHTYEEKKEMKDLENHITTYKRIKANYQGNRLFKKLAPDLMLLNYYRDIDNDTKMGILDYVMKTGGIASDYSPSSKLADAMLYMKRGDNDAANGAFGSIIGDQMSIPLWRSYKEWYKMVKWPFVGVSSDFQKPNDFVEGAFYGGALEDWGVLDRNSTITVLPGIGVKSYDRFKAAGYEKMSDLKKNPEWYNATYTDENGNEHYILDANYRKSVKDAADKWFKEND